MSRITNDSPKITSIVGKMVTRCSSCSGFGFSRDEQVTGVYDQYATGAIVKERNVECRHCAELAGRVWQRDSLTPTFVPTMEPIAVRDPSTGETAPAPILPKPNLVQLEPRPDADLALSILKGAPVVEERKSVV